MEFEGKGYPGLTSALLADEARSRTACRGRVVYGYRIVRDGRTLQEGEIRAPGAVVSCLVPR